MKKKLKSLEYAFWLLKLRDRSIGEMEEKLKRKEFSGEEVSKTLTFLIDKNFLDDERYAENYIRNKKLIKPVGKYYLRGKLLEKKIPTDTIEKALLENSDQIDEVKEAASRWISKHQNIEKIKMYEKLSRHLISRGFDWEKVREVLNSKL